MTAIETLYEWRALISTIHLCDKFKDILLDLNVGEAIGDTRGSMLYQLEVVTLWTMLLLRFVNL